MPFTAYEKWSARRGPSFSVNGNRAERTWIVPGATNASEALSADGIAAYNSTHPQDGTIKVDSLEPSSPDGPTFWQVTATYSKPASGGDHGGGDIDPLNQALRLRFDLTITAEPVDRSIDHFAIVNSARDPFDNRPTRPIYEWSVTARKNVTVNAWINLWTIAKAAQGKVNDASVTFLSHEFDIGTILLARMLPLDEFGEDSTYVPVGWTFQFREYPADLPNDFGEKRVDKSPFQLWIIDQGLGAYYNDAGTLKHEKFVDGDDKQPVNTPVLLDGDGTPVNPSFKLGSTQKDAFTQNRPPGAFAFNSADTSVNNKFVTLIYKNCTGYDFTALGL